MLRTLLLSELPSTDACGESTISVVESIVSGACSGTYEIHRLFTATDPCLNSTSGTQIITVVDNTAPVLTIPLDITVECSENFDLLPATAEDDCSYSEITVLETTVLGNAIGNYTIARTFTAVDACGNTSSDTQVITVLDTTSPSLIVPSDYTSECSNDLVYNDASATDNCGTTAISVVESTIPGNAAGNYTVVRTFTATDDAGNATTLAQTITVEDTTAPELTIPGNFVVECSDAITLDQGTATDNCGAVTVSVSDETIAGSSSGTYLIVRTHTASDDAGNSSSSVQTITVIDTTAPELSVPSDYTVECSDEIVLADATSTDNCGTSTIAIASQTVAGNATGDYTIVRTFTASDDAGNTTTSIQTITVQDSTAPILSGVPEDATVECSNVPTPSSDVTATDNCGSFTIDFNEVSTPGSCDGQYTLTRTWTATDDADNTSSLSQVISVIDTTAPEFEPLSD